MNQPEIEIDDEINMFKRSIATVENDDTQDVLNTKKPKFSDCECQTNRLESFSDKFELLSLQIDKITNLVLEIASQLKQFTEGFEILN
jgi:hypothetical protein